MDIPNDDIRNVPQEAEVPEAAERAAIASLPLGGHPRSTSHVPYCIRLVHHFPFGAGEFERLNERSLHYPEDGAQSPCAWEAVPGIADPDSFLGCVRLGGVDGLEPFLDRMLYFDPKPAALRYLVFRLKNCHLQQFKGLSYRPRKDYAISLDLHSLEFLPFRDGNAFLSSAFVCRQADKSIELRAALEVNYHLPLVRGKIWPLVSAKAQKDLYLPALFAQARAALLADASELARCWNSKAELELTQIDRRLFLMSHAVLGVSSEDWQGERVAQARHLYHQITRFSDDAYYHDVPAKVSGQSPEKVKAGGAPTRTHEFRQHGVTFLGLGANEFEGNNFLPKFRGSYLFALLLARDIHFVLCAARRSGASDSPEVRAALHLLQNEVFTKNPRQEFFRDCLRFWLGDGYAAQSPNPAAPGAPSIPASPAPSIPAALPAPSTEAEEDRPYVFRKQGDYWEIAFRGEKILQKHVVGLDYIHELLRRPDQRIDCIELRNAFRPPKAREGNRSESQVEGGCEEKARVSWKRDPQADAGMQKLKAALDEIDGDLQDAKERNDEKETERLEEQRAGIVGELRQMQQFSQASKDPGKEEARKSVSLAIDRAIDKIRENNQEVSDFLDESIETGNSCLYKSDRDVNWEL